MFDFHKDKPRYFKYQYLTASDHILPFLKKNMEVKPEYKVLEIGSAEAGVLKAFIENGNTCTGVELSAHRVKLAEELLKQDVEEGKVRFLAKNVYDIDIEKDIGHKFDLIILKDVIEHIHNQEVFLNKLKHFLTPNGKVFFGFPPWQMPFGGHQQISSIKLLSILPYYHLLPMPIYKGILKMFGEKQQRIDDLVEIKETGISIERFERILKKEHYRILKKQLFLFNPIYQYKFNLKTRHQSTLIASIPVLRNFVSTCGYYLIDSPE